MECANCFRDDVPLFIVTCDACYAAAPSSSVQCKSCIDARKRVNNHLVCIKCSSPTKLRRRTWYTRCFPCLEQGLRWRTHAASARGMLIRGAQSLMETQESRILLNLYIIVFSALWVIQMLFLEWFDYPFWTFVVCQLFTLCTLADGVLQRVLRFTRPAVMCVQGICVALYALHPMLIALEHVVYALISISYVKVHDRRIRCAEVAPTMIVGMQVFFIGLYIVLVSRFVYRSVRNARQIAARAFETDVEFIPV